MTCRHRHHQGNCSTAVAAIISATEHYSASAEVLSRVILRPQPTAAPYQNTIAAQSPPEIAALFKPAATRCLMAEVDPIFVKLDRLITLSRLNELANLLNTDRSYRILRMAVALKPLKPGAYLLGTGPYTVGIIPLSVDEVVLGRAATPVEDPGEKVIDYLVADTVFFSPYETSRAHAKVVRRRTENSEEYTVCDLGSSCGTFLNGEQVDSEGRALSHGDVISLGPSQVNTYMVFLA